MSTINEDTTLVLRCMYNIYYPSSPVKFFINVGIIVLPPPPINKVMVFVYAKKGINTGGILRDKNACGTSVQYYPHSEKYYNRHTLHQT